MILDYVANKIEKEINYFNRYNQALYISGHTGMGKSYAALKYCSKNKDCLYFSFANMDSSFALKVFSQSHSDIFKPVSDWNNFFELLKTQAKEKRLTVFFDNAGERNDKDDFYSALSLFLETNATVKIILIGKTWNTIDVPFREVSVLPVSTQELADILQIKNELAVEIFCLTSGIPTLLEEYNTDISFDENINLLLNTNSKFYRLALQWMSECFRTPETYNTLLCGMASGYNRINELSAFANYPKNKCDKYIKALQEHNLVQKVEEKNGHSRYYPANSYLCLWYRFLLTAVPSVDGTYSEELYTEFKDYFSKNILSEFYNNMCTYWLKHNISSFCVSVIDTTDVAYRNITLDDITFDFVCQKGDTTYYAYYNTVPGNTLTAKLWNAIEKATTKSCPFYKNEYIICTVNRVPDSYWSLSQTYDNVHIVQLKSLFATYNKNYNSTAHPRFVPSFVRKRN